MQTYLVLIQLIQCLGFDLLNGIVLAGRYMLSLVDLSVLLARTKQVYFLEILFPKHLE